MALGFCYLKLAPGFAGTLGGRLFEFVATFGAWRRRQKAIIPARSAQRIIFGA